MTTNTKVDRLPPTDNTAELHIDINSIQGITQDSRVVGEGFLFAAIKGEKVDGRDYIPDAVAKGASIILADKNAQIDEDQLGSARVVYSDNPRKDFSHLASQFYNDQPEHIVAVTGTNGKSSVVNFARQLWDAIGVKGGMMGTLNNSLTTPEPTEFFRKLQQLKREEGISHMAIEASSHGLDQYRIDGAKVSVGAFTNFSQDHLDFHLDMESYFTAKVRLFEDLLPISGGAVLNADVEEFKSLSGVCKRRGIPVLSYGEKGEEIKLLERRISGISQEVDVQIFGNKYSMQVPFVGSFQVINVLCALGCVIAEHNFRDEVSIETLIGAVGRLKPAPGRLQHVTDKTGVYNSYVDYAHTPDALETVLKSLRPHTKGRLICVFGCGGDRDAGKRPLMGEIASRLADVVVITDDNPRSEEPEGIRDQIYAGANSNSENETSVHIIEGRGKAIGFAVNMMKPEDILLVAGKGHEQGQIVGGKILPFDDVVELGKAFDAMSNTKTDFKG